LKNYWVYILASKTGTVYIGVTGHLEKRAYEHRNKLIPGFTAEYNINRLVYFQEFTRIEQAIEMEKKVKGWSRQKKIDLIRTINFNMRDLAEDLI